MFLAEGELAAEGKGMRGSASLISNPYSLVHLLGLSFPSASSFIKATSSNSRLAHGSTADCRVDAADIPWMMEMENTPWLQYLPVIWLALQPSAPGPHEAGAPPAHHHFALHRHHVWCSRTFIHANASDYISPMPQYAPHLLFPLANSGQNLLSRRSIEGLLRLAHHKYHEGWYTMSS